MITPPPSSFADVKDNLFICLRLDIYTDVAKLNKWTWVIQLSPLLTGKAVEVYIRLPPEEAKNYLSMPYSCSVAKI